jgi:CheY-like chemotaxis protein
MRMLMVEDEVPKQRHISSFLNEVVRDLDLQVARSVNSAVERLEGQTFDLMLLDMSLPTFDQDNDESGGRPQGFGGIEVVREIQMAGVRCMIVVITGYEVFPKGDSGQLNIRQLKDDLEGEFKDLVVGVLHYNSAVDEWKTNLINIFERIGVALK